MVQFLAKKTALYLAKDDETADVEVLTYGCYLIYQEWFVRVVMLLAALPFGLFFHVLAGIISFTLVRRCAMGAHARHPTICLFTTVVVVYGPAVLAEQFSLGFMLIPFVGLYIFGIVLLLLYAPAETDVKKVPDPRERKRLKIESIVWLSVCFLVAAVLQNWFAAIAFVVATSAALACCFVHPWMYSINGFDPVTKEERE